MTPGPSRDYALLALGVNEPPTNSPNPTVWAEAAMDAAVAARLKEAEDKLRLQNTVARGEGSPDPKEPSPAPEVEEVAEPGAETAGIPDQPLLSALLAASVSPPFTGPRSRSPSPAQTNATNAAIAAAAYAQTSAILDSTSSTTSSTAAAHAAAAVAVDAANKATIAAMQPPDDDTVDTNAEPAVPQEWQKKLQESEAMDGRGRAAAAMEAAAAFLKTRLGLGSAQVEEDASSPEE